MDEEQLEILERYVEVKKKGNRLDQIANDYGTNTKDIKDRVRSGLKWLINYYKSSQGNALTNESVDTTIRSTRA